MKSLYDITEAHFLTRYTLSRCSSQRGSVFFFFKKSWQANFYHHRHSIRHLLGSVLLHDDHFHLSQSWR
jgi:hypothetical protein